MDLLLKRIDIHMLAPSVLNLPAKAEQYAASPVPSVEDFENLWSAWDMVSRGMIPKEELISRPITLRNCLVFYLGHIPTFLGRFL